MPPFYLCYLTWEGKHPYPNLAWEQTEHKEATHAGSGKNQDSNQAGLSLILRNFEACAQTPENKGKVTEQSSAEEAKRTGR